MLGEHTQLEGGVPGLESFLWNKHDSGIHQGHMHDAGSHHSGGVSPDLRHLCRTPVGMPRSQWTADAAAGSAGAAAGVEPQSSWGPQTRHSGWGSS